MNQVWLKKLTTIDEYDTLVELAKKDEHSVCAATHVVTKGGEIVGYASIAGIPLVLCWLDTKKVKARESFGLLNLVENQVALNGGGGMFLPVQKTSPFHPLMSGLGYGDCGEYTLFLKTF